MLLSESGPELMRLRTLFGVSRRKAAELLNVSEQSLYRWEILKSKAHPHLARKFESLLDILSKKETAERGIRK